MSDQKAGQPSTGTAVAPPHPFMVTKSLFASDMVKSKFGELLGRRAPQFISSVIAVVSNNALLQKADANSILQAASMAATLDLPVNQSLGHAWIVPYAGKAQFQIGYKGFVQLAMRSGQYHKINVIEVYKNQFESFDVFYETFKADFTVPGEGEPIGYMARFELLNGFEKCVYWTREAVIKHAQRFSKSYTKSDSPWVTDFDKMAMKTVLKDMLSHWGPLSIEMQRAIISDDRVIKDAENDLTEDAESEMVPDEYSPEFTRAMEALTSITDATSLKNMVAKVPIEKFTEFERNAWATAVADKQKSLG